MTAAEVRGIVSDGPAAPRAGTAGHLRPPTPTVLVRSRDVPDGGRLRVSVRGEPMTVVSRTVRPGGVTALSLSTQLPPAEAA